ncbi:hypothetical protein B566_EDAN007779 [Ephemera danica]|nr:hypothetical protein B566_EDAN007779 [Ephemera danica]
MQVKQMLLLAVLQLSWASVQPDANYKGIEPKEFVTLGNRRYYFSPIGIRNVISAAKSCNDVGATLVALETEEENAAIFAYINDTLQTTSTERYWTSGVRMWDNWMWSANSQIFSYLNWHAGEPDIKDQVTQMCVLLYDGGMWDSDCDFSDYHFICEEKNCPVIT